MNNIWSTKYRRRSKNSSIFCKKQMIWYRDGSCYQKSRQNCQQIIGSYFSHRRVKNRQWHVFFISQVMERGCKIKFAGLIANKKWLSKTQKTDKRRLKRNSSGGNWQPGFVPWRKIMNGNWGRKIQGNFGDETQKAGIWENHLFYHSKIAKVENHVVQRHADRLGAVFEHVCHAGSR